MVLDYYKLAAAPFGDTPDPRFLYLGAKHREALASLLMGTESNRGFLAVIAKPGMGKTSLLYRFLQLLGSRARTVFVFQTDCDSREFIRHILLDLGIDALGKDLPAMHEMLNRLLTEEMRAGRRFVLVIDEAQNLEEKVLESVRLLSNFETPWTKLMQIVLAGQPQLAKRLSRPSMLQLHQRLSMVIRLEPFTFEETKAYINHRLRAAGYEGPSLFTVGARRLISEQSQGIPRNINTICFNAMALACATNQKTIDRSVVVEVLNDLDLESLREETVQGSEVNQGRQVWQGQSHDKKKSFLGTWLRRLVVASTLLLLVLGWPSTLNTGELSLRSNAASALDATPGLLEPLATMLSPDVQRVALPATGALPAKAGKP
jgi:type II secretory pathway predicted ATPase ExeA